MGDNVKMTSFAYIEFRKANLQVYLKKTVFKQKFLFMHDNAPPHAVGATIEYLNK